MQLEYFQMVDRITDLDIGKRTISVESQVPQASPVFEGHFPGYPLMPGVLLTELMAQSCGFLLLSLGGFAASGWVRHACSSRGFSGRPLTRHRSFSWTRWSMGLSRIASSG